jgi:hypothetical protein
VPTTPYDKGSSVSDKNLWSKDWANWILRYGARELRGKRFLWHRNMVIQEINAYVELLALKGFWWQSIRLANHLHKAIKFTDPKGLTATAVAHSLEVSP